MFEESRRFGSHERGDLRPGDEDRGDPRRRGRRHRQYLRVHPARQGRSHRRHSGPGRRKKTPPFQARGRRVPGAALRQDLAFRPPRSGFVHRRGRSRTHRRSPDAFEQPPVTEQSRYHKTGVSDDRKASADAVFRIRHRLPENFRRLLQPLRVLRYSIDSRPGPQSNAGRYFEGSDHADPPGGERNHSHRSGHHRLRIRPEKPSDTRRASGRSFGPSRAVLASGALYASGDRKSRRICQSRFWTLWQGTPRSAGISTCRFSTPTTRFLPP
jgi:hypothetical protein